MITYNKNIKVLQVNKFKKPLEKSSGFFMTEFIYLSEENYHGPDTFIVTVVVYVSDFSL